jgi:hypothetical protein
MKHKFPLQQIEAPDGYGPLKKGIRYHVLRCRTPQDRLILVSFFSLKPESAIESKSQPCYEIDFILREGYETGCATGRIRRIEKEEEIKWLPPWLEALIGINFDNDEDFTLPPRNKARKKDPISHKDRVEQRVSYLARAEKRIDEILGSPSPEKVLNQIARTFTHPETQKESRYRLWFFVWVAFGGNKWALLPPYHLGGSWDRWLEGREFEKPGRESEHGAFHGYRIDPSVRKKIFDAFEKHAKEGRFRVEVYAESLKENFHCIYVRDEKGRQVPKSKTGEPFPTERQFWHHVTRRYGKDEIERRLLGGQKARLEKAVPQGSFSEAVADVREVIYWDAAYTHEHPRSYIKRLTLPRLPVVEAIDGASGCCLGLGMTLGAESAATYKAALFCMVIPASRFGKIIGMRLSDDDLPGSGSIPLDCSGDRGKATSKEVRIALIEFLAAIESAPTYTPQSDAPVEARHERHRKTLGAPSHRRSDLSPVESFRRVVRTAVFRNRSSSALGRATPATVAAGVKTPLDMYKHLESRGRVTGIPVPFDEAVRAFTEDVVFTVKDGFPTLHGLRYRSKALLNDSEWKARVRSLEGGKLQGHMLEISVKTGWLEFGGRLIEIDAVAEIHGAKEELYLSLPELVEFGEEKARLEAELRHDRPHELVAAMNDFEDETGKKWNGGRTVAGRMKKTKAVKEEIKASRLSRSDQ